MRLRSLLDGSALHDTTLDGELDSTTTDSAKKPGVWKVDTLADADLAEISEHGWNLFLVDLTEVDSKSDLMNRFAEHPSFPAWFGKNWDALADSLGELLNQPDDKPTLLTIRHADALSDNSPATLRVLIEIISEASTETDSNFAAILEQREDNPQVSTLP